MLDLESGDRIELYYEDAPATTIRATVGRMSSGEEEGMGAEVEDYIVGWAEIIPDTPSETSANQVLLFGTDFQHWLNGRQVSVRKRQE